LLARKGFHTSEMLMADSVALLRRKVEDASLAVQDGTMNSVITLATIEVGALDFPSAFTTDNPSTSLARAISKLQKCMSTE
jgi:hypothetical protein